MQINWILLFMTVMLVVSWALSSKINWTIWYEIKQMEQNEKMYQNWVNWIVNMSWINQWYTFTGVKCNGSVTKCFENNLWLFYNNKALITKHVVYFTNNDLKVNFTKKGWYKNPENIKDINSKIYRWVYIPPISQLGVLAGMKDLNILLNSHSNLKNKFYLSPLWFK